MRLLLRDCLTHIEEMDGLISTIQNQRDNLNEDMVSRISTLEYQLSERDAQCAAMREALEQTKTIPMPNPWCWKRDKALSSAAGRDLLERLQKAESERDEYMTALAMIIDQAPKYAKPIAEAALKVSEAQAAQFLKEYREGKHPLSKEDESALERSKPELMRRLKALQPKEAK